VHVQTLVSVVKMATVLADCTTEEQRSVVHFMSAERLSAKFIHTEIFSVYGGKCLPHTAVHNWVEKFSQGRCKLPVMPNQVTLLRLRQKEVCSGWKSSFDLTGG
jgi:hypothetical protein